MKINRRQFLHNTALLGCGLMANFAFGDRGKKNISLTIAENFQSHSYFNISPSGEFFLYYLSAACNT